MPFFFHTFTLSYVGQFGLPRPLLTAYHQPSDRYTELRSIASSVTLALSFQQLAALPTNFDGWQVERSDDQGITWAAVSAMIRDSFYYVDVPPSPDTYHYRCRMRLSDGTYSFYSLPSIVSIGEWGNADNLSVQEVDPSTGAVTDRWAPTQAFPNGLGSDKHTGMGMSPGSLAGAYAEGVWYLRTKEIAAPQIVNHVPACGAVAALPLTVMTYTIEDLPALTGSGIDDTTLVVTLSVLGQLGGAGQFGGAALIIRNGATQPWAAATPAISCVSVNGTDPLRDRDITITVPAGYLSSDDIVTITTVVKDLDGNELRETCSFTMDHEDEIPPTVTEQSPACGTGITTSTRAKRDTAYSFLVDDADSGVDLATLQVYIGTASTGPWTQVLQNGSTFLIGYTGFVTATSPAGGYNVTIKRPVTSPLWSANATTYFRVLADDLSGNSVEDICGFKTEDEATISRIVALADDLLILEFSTEVRDGQVLRAPENYVIVPDASEVDAANIKVRKVIPQRFLPPKDLEQTGPTRLGLGNPRYVVLETTPHTAWGVYRISTLNLQDQHGLPHAAWTDDGIKYRGQFTMLNEARADLEDEEMLGQDTAWRAALSAVMFSQQQLSGVFIPDNWEET